MINDAPHIGLLIREKLKENGQSVTWLARKLCYERNNIYRIFKKKTIDTELLAKISILLNYDFFSHLSIRINDDTKV
jgi:plasmid maintenance system antidote protein VapI